MMGFQPVHTNAMIPPFSPPNLKILKCDIADNLLLREKSTFKTIDVKFYLFNELIREIYDLKSSSSQVFN